MFFIAGVVYASEKYTLDNLDDVATSFGETRCGDYLIQTKDAGGEASIMFRFSANGQESLRLVPSGGAKLVIDDSAKNPVVEVPTTRAVIVSTATFTMSAKDAEKANACLPTS